LSLSASGSENAIGFEANELRDRGKWSEMMPGRNVGKQEREGRIWNLKEIEQLIDLLVAREISEFEMEQDGLRLRIKRGFSYEPPPGSGALPVHYTGSPGTSSPVPANALTAADSSPTESIEDLYIIKSPIVGTFYNAPSPNAPPFVKAGDVVHAGQVLCIIEAMKLMNDIESEVAGEIVRIYAENGQPVEYGQSLFAIKPSHKK
jgi:acetyl-CoA carboxylase biotin carboxyl carrier protein